MYDCNKIGIKNEEKRQKFQFSKRRIGDESKKKNQSKKIFGFFSSDFK